MKKTIWIVSLCALLILSACGTGGENSGSGSSSDPDAFYQSHLTDKEAKIDFCAAPDFTRYAYASNDGAAAELVVGSVSGEKAVYTAPKDSGLYNPQWSPDGKMIAFKVLSPNESTNASVYILNVADNKAVETGVTVSANRFLTNEAYYSWSSDSQKLLIESRPIVYWDVKAGRQVQVSEEYKVDSTGKETGEKSLRAAFSPNGKKIAYTALGENDGKGCTYIKIFDIARGAVGASSYVSIPPGYVSEVSMSLPIWASDTKVLSRVVGRPAWYEMDTTNGGIEAFDPLGTDSLEVKPSPDGKLLAVVRGGGTEYKFSLLHLETLAETPLEGAQGQHLDWSADGTTLINWGNRIIRLFGADDGKQSADTRHIPVQIYSAPIIVGDTVYYENKVS